MIRAWRREDGRYRLTGDSAEDESRAVRARYRLGEGYSVREDQLGDLDAAKVFGVVTGPSSCGCEPAGFRWVTEGEVEAGRTSPGWCPHCKAAPGIQGHFHQCVIVDVCGEADVAEAVYQAEFKASIDGTAPAWNRRAGEIASGS